MQGITTLPEGMTSPPAPADLPLDGRRRGRDDMASGRTQLRWLPEVVLVVEGAARPAADDIAGPVQAVAAPGSGDDTIAALAASTAGRRVVVTADRELRQRCVAAGASLARPTVERQRAPIRPRRP